MSLEEITKLHGDIVGAIFTSESELGYHELAEKFFGLATLVNLYDGDKEDWRNIGRFDYCNVSDLFSAAYWHYCEWHEGQDSDSYVVMSGIRELFKSELSAPPDEEDDSDAALCFSYLNVMAVKSQE